MNTKHLKDFVARGQAAQKAVDKLTKPEAKHTPTPWKMGGLSGRMITTEKQPYYGDGFIADVDTKANSEFIVRAVNEYDSNQATIKALVEAAKKASIELRIWRCEQAEENNTSPAWMSEAELDLEKALAQAQEVK